jgi:hypothetical protein
MTFWWVTIPRTVLAAAQLIFSAWNVDPACAI